MTPNRRTPGEVRIDVQEQHAQNINSARAAQSVALDCQNHPRPPESGFPIGPNRFPASRHRYIDPCHTSLFQQHAPLDTPMKKSLIALSLGLGTLLATASASAAEHVVKMLNFGKDGSMVFEPAYLNVAVGDTVVFEPTNSGHHVRSLSIPEGVTSFRSPLDEKFTLKIEKEGLYFYDCPPHLMMAMIGLIQAGKPVNREAVEKSMKQNRGRMMSNGKRVDALLQAIR